MSRREDLISAHLPSAHLVMTDASDGDLSCPEPGAAVTAELEARRRRIVAHPWTWLRQVHGARVVEVDAPGEWSGAEADAAVTTTPGAVLAVHTADCAGVALVGDGEDPVTGEPVRVLGVAHAGWRGLRAGILEATVDLMRRLGAHDVVWDLGACISPAAYEFGESDLDELCDQFGAELRSSTLDGAPALDLRAGVRSALERCGVRGPGPEVVPCTALDDGFYSWRARRDVGRQATVGWLESAVHRLR